MGARATGGVDDEIGKELSSLGCFDTDHMVRVIGADEDPRDHSSAVQRYVGLVESVSHDSLDYGTATGDEPKALIAIALPSGNRRRNAVHGADLECASVA